MAVSFSSIRWFRSVSVLAAPVSGRGADAAAFSNRPALNTHTRLLAIGPPTVPSRCEFTSSLCVAWVKTSYGVRVLHRWLVSSSRTLPENRSPPLLVTAFTTPPEKRPYSADKPEVSVCVSAMASSTNRFCGEPRGLSLISTPSILNTLSNANAPLIETWAAFGVIVVKPGESCAMPTRVRGIARTSTSSCAKLAPAMGLSIGDGIPVTSAVVNTPSATPIVTSSRVGRPSQTRADRLAVSAPGNPKVA